MVRFLAARSRSFGVCLVVGCCIPLCGPSAGSAYVVRHLTDLPAPARMALAGDLSGDGVDDLAVASDCAVYVMPGRPEGGFAAPVPHPVVGSGCAPRRVWLTSGDTDGDGAVDLILTRGDEPLVWVLRGQGGGGFAAPVSYPTATGQAAQGVAAADLNGDERDDIVVVEKTQSLFFPIDLAVLVANASGGFAAGVRYGQSFRTAENLTVGHLDDDANADVLVGVQRCDAGLVCQGGVMRFSGNGDGTIGTPVIVDGIPQTAGQFVPTATQFPWALIAAPLRGLGRDDLIVTSGGVQTLLSSADGTLTARPQATSAGGWGDVADLDRDGALDLAAVFGDVGAVLLGDGAGDFDVEGRITFSPMASSLQLADVDRDAWPDMVVTSDTGRVDALMNSPTAVLDSDALEFPGTLVGSSAPAQSIELFNGGVRPLRVTGTSLAGPHGLEFRVTADGCSGVVLAVTESCGISVAFAPVVSGARHSELLVASDDWTSPARAELAGSGIGASVGPAAPAAVSSTADRAAPSASIKVSRQRLDGALRNGLKVRVVCSEACGARIKLAVDRKTARALHLRSPRSGLIVGQRGIAATGARTLAARVPFTTQLRRAAKRVARLDLTVTAAVEDLAGNRAPLKRSPVRLLARR